MGSRSIGGEGVLVCVLSPRTVMQGEDEEASAGVSQEVPQEPTKGK